MKIRSVLIIAAVAAAGWSGVQAQSSTKAVPAEFPPASFSGRQYVDSKGCVFIRAGTDGAATWVPRMTRSRTQICGFKPTLSASERAAVVAPRTATAAVTEPTSVASTTVASTPVVSTASSPAPAVPAEPKAVPVVAPEAEAVVSASTCTDRSTFSQQFLISDVEEVRCGPQTEPHVTIRSGERSVQLAEDLSRTQVRVAPKHVYENQLASIEGISIPEGYQAVWEDDRLNPRRAHQTLAGKAQMDLIWTQTVPRRLIPVEGGALLSEAAGGVPTRATPNVPAAPEMQLAPDTAPASHRYVQIGAFTDPERARQTATQIANSGLPAKIGPHKQGGQSYTLVVVGPFQTQSELDQSFARVRGLGYVSASLRK